MATISSVKDIKFTASRKRLTLEKVRKPQTFKYQIPKKNTLHEGSVSLKGGGNIKITAGRNMNDYGRIVPVAGSGKQEQPGNWTCNVVKWDAEIINRDTAILNPQFSKIYVGAVYDFASIAKGEYKTLPYARKPMTIVSDNVHFKKASTVIAAPSSGSVASGILALKAGAKPGGSRTVGTTFEMLSEEDFFMRTGGSGYYLGFGGNHEINFKSESKSHKYVVEVYQAYYTIFVDDTTNEPTDFFYTTTEAPNKQDAIAPIKLDPNWVYVDSVTYGRMLYLVYESDYDFNEFGIDVNLYANVGFAGATANLTEKQKKALSQTRITVGAVGGNPIYSALLSNPQSFQDLKKRIDDYFKQQNDETIIAFTLRTLDQSTVGTRMITQYTSRQCAPRASRYRVTWEKVQNTVNDDSGNASEIKAFARIRAFGGNGKEIMDTGNINKAIGLWDAQPEAVKKIVPKPWTFTVGSEGNPLELAEGHFWNVNKRIEFNIPREDANAKLAIRTDVVEFDSSSANDHFEDNIWERKISELADANAVTLVCRHDASRITFMLNVEPLYE